MDSPPDRCAALPAFTFALILFIAACVLPTLITARPHAAKAGGVPPTDERRMRLLKMIGE